MAAKNHATILPDADREATVNALVGAAFGAAGQRCMALSTAVFVGEAKVTSSFVLSLSEISEYFLSLSHTHTHTRTHTHTHTYTHKHI